MVDSIHTIPGMSRNRAAANRCDVARAVQTPSKGRDQAGPLQATVNRLRASKHQCEEADYQRGLGLGKTWAERSAEAAALQRLEQLHDELDAQPQYGWNSCFEQHEGTAYGPGELLYFALHSEDDEDRQAARAFWEVVAGDSLQKAAFPGSLLKGFAEGALEVWMAVKEEL